jgi:hypothetical protein
MVALFSHRAILMRSALVCHLVGLEAERARTAPGPSTNAGFFYQLVLVVQEPF